MAVIRTIPQIIAAGCVPYYDNEGLYIFKNTKTQGLQFYKASFENYNNQWQTIMTQLESLTDLLKVKDLMPSDMRQNLILAANKQGIPTMEQIIPVNIGDTLYIENDSGQWSEGRVLDKAIQSNTTYFYLHCPDKSKWLSENELGKTVLTPEQFKQKPSVSRAREDELQELYYSETADKCTKEWRNNLTEDEQNLVDKWDAAYEKGVHGRCQRIMERQKLMQAPQMF